MYIKSSIISFRVLSPNTGEIAQGYALGMGLGATKNDFDMTIGIHPTCSEVRFYISHFLPDKLLCFFFRVYLYLNNKQKSVIITPRDQIISKINE